MNETQKRKLAYDEFYGFIKVWLYEHCKYRVDKTTLLDLKDIVNKLLDGENAD